MAVYIQWMCTAPWNNKEKTETPRYEGVGGHLFAISGSISEEAGFDGYVFGFASNKEVLAHYIEKLGAIHIGILHPYQFAIEADAMKKINKWRSKIDREPVILKELNILWE